MNTKHWIRQLRSSPHLTERMRAVRNLKDHSHHQSVHVALCLTAVDTRHQTLRAALMAILKDDPQAEAFFLGVVRGQGPVYMRKWAFLNLSIMGSKRARTSVLAGLLDPNDEVARAAASHVTLYTDEEARQAFIHYFQIQRQFYLQDAAGRLGMRLRRWWRGLKAIRWTPRSASMDKIGQVRG